jgi:hypothetical protein
VEAARSPTQRLGIEALEAQMNRFERGMLIWSGVTAFFTVVLAFLAGVQAYSFVESERAF